MCSWGAATGRGRSTSRDAVASAAPHHRRYHCRSRPPFCRSTVELNCRALGTVIVAATVTLRRIPSPRSPSRVSRVDDRSHRRLRHALLTHAAHRHPKSHKPSPSLPPPLSPPLSPPFPPLWSPPVSPECLRRRPLHPPHPQCRGCGCGHRLLLRARPAAAAPAPSPSGRMSCKRPPLGADPTFHAPPARGPPPHPRRHLIGWCASSSGQE